MFQEEALGRYLGMNPDPFFQATTYYRAPYIIKLQIMQPVEMYVPPDTTSAWTIDIDGFGIVPHFRFEYATIANDYARSTTYFYECCKSTG